MTRHSSRGTAAAPRARSTMKQLLFQGVDGVPDRSEELKSESRAAAFRIPAPCSLTPERVAEGDTLHEECGVTAIHGHPDAARQAALYSEAVKTTPVRPPAAPPRCGGQPARQGGR